MSIWGVLMGFTRENAMKILKAMVEWSRKRGSCNALKMMTHLKSDEINGVIECLEEMKMVKTLPACNKVEYNFLNVILEPEGCRYYSEHFGRIKATEWTIFNIFQNNKTEILIF